VSGALDAPSMEFANSLVGNTRHTPVLEITLSGPRIRSETDGSIALAGANFGLHINDKEVDSARRIVVKAGDEISFSPPSNGCRAYLALEGNWQVQRWLGSASALLIGSYELLPSAVWKSGDALTTLPRRVDPWPSTHLAPQPLTNKIRAFRGPEFHWLSEGAQTALFNTELTVCEPSNRVGLRANTPFGFSEDYENIEMQSSGVMPGTVQLTPGGQAIALLADGQTIGGYPRILQCSQSSMRKLGQLRVGDAFSFEVLPTPV
jgi:antagonist of KipI